MTARARAAATVLILLVLSGACGSPSGAPEPTPGYRSFGDPSQLAEGSPAPGGQATNAPSTSGGATTVTSRPRVTIPPTAAAGTTAVRANDQGPNGANAKLYLQPGVPKLIVEMVAVKGREPLQQSIDFMRQTLEEVVDKPRGIDFRLTETFAATKDVYTDQDIESLESKYRRGHSNENEAFLWILFVNGRSAENEQRMGAAYRASSLVIFTDVIKSVSTPTAPRNLVERLVLVHEIGHSLALLNGGYKSPRDHVDKTDDPSRCGCHSKNKGSVMYWASDTSLIVTLFQGPPPDKFDADDLADLADLRANRL